ncbi:MAG: hypothetical protein IJ666_02115 [Ruminococcus sp.]|nr:hypothetical protein [Ruminococcus sp.]
MNKKIFVPLLFLPVLTSCAAFDKGEGRIISDDFVFITTAPVQAERLSDESVVEIADNIEENNELNFEVSEKVLRIYSGDEKIQEIELRFSPNKDDIRTADYDFDGDEDIFIPYDLNTTDMGLYYCYDAESRKFTPSDHLNYIGHLMTVTEDNTLLEELIDNDDYYDQTVEFIWENGAIKQYKRKVRYVSTLDGKLYEETYEYDEKGQEYFSGVEIIEEEE